LELAEVHSQDAGVDLNDAKPGGPSCPQEALNVAVAHPGGCLGRGKIVRLGLIGEGDGGSGDEWHWKR
jgi:hypothetical protein